MQLLQRSLDSSFIGIPEENCLVFLQGNLAGQFKFNRLSLLSGRAGICYFCPRCGDIWARIVFQNRSQRDLDYAWERVACEKHPDAFGTIAGSLLTGPLMFFLDYFPRPLLQREFIIHMNRR